MKVIELPLEIVSFILDFIHPVERCWLRQTCSTFNRVSEQFKYSYADYIMLRCDKTLLLDALFVSNTTTAKTLRQSIRFCDIPFFQWLKKHKIISMSNRLYNETNVGQFRDMLQPNRRRYFSTDIITRISRDDPEKVDVILQSIPPGKLSTYSATALMVHFLIRPLPASKALFIKWLADNHPTVAIHLYQEHIIHCIITSKYTQKIKKTLLQAPELAVSPSETLISLLAWHGSKWLECITLVSPITRTLMETTITNNMRKRTAVPTNRRRYNRSRLGCLGSNRHGCGNHLNNVNVNLANVAKLANIDLDAKTQRMLKRTALERAKRKGLCCAIIASGIRTDDYCLRTMPCNVHRKRKRAP